MGNTLAAACVGGGGGPWGAVDLYLVTYILHLSSTHHLTSSIEIQTHAADWKGSDTAEAFLSFLFLLASLSATVFHLFLHSLDRFHK